MRSHIKKFILPIVLFCVFGLFSASLLFVDRQPIGPSGSVVGFATVNGFFRDLIGTHSTWYTATDVLGKATFIVVGLFALLGLGQCIARRNPLRVNKDILAMAGFYVVVGVFYILFEFVIVNYRPVLMEGVLEASYPSSHTMLACCILGSAIVWFYKNLKKGAPRTVLCIEFSLLIAVMVVGRLLSGVHWFTDIVGGVLLSLALVSLYNAVIDILPRK